MKKIINSAVLLLGLTASFAVCAQQTQTPPQGAPQNPERRERMGRMSGMHRRMAMRRHGMKLMRGLDLSDAQREQMRAVRERYRQSTQAQREELRQLFRTKRQGGQLTPEQEARARQLRAELRQTRERIHADMLGLLTPEQRTRLEQLKQERKARVGEMRQRRMQKRGEQDQPPPQ
jgi:Spy/CpxP family protein refolding chaperone